jgi:hypothetical protein
MTSGIERNISLKRRSSAPASSRHLHRQPRRILEAAERHAFFVRIDMEARHAPT